MKCLLAATCGDVGWSVCMIAFLWSAGLMRKDGCTPIRSDDDCPRSGVPSQCEMDHEVPQHTHKSDLESYPLCIFLSKLYEKSFQEANGKGCISVLDDWSRFILSFLATGLVGSLCMFDFSALVSQEPENLGA